MITITVIAGIELSNKKRFAKILIRNIPRGSVEKIFKVMRTVFYKLRNVSMESANFPSFTHEHNLRTGEIPVTAENINHFDSQFCKNEVKVSSLNLENSSHIANCEPLIRSLGCSFENNLSNYYTHLRVDTFAPFLQSVCRNLVQLMVYLVV